MTKAPDSELLRAMLKRGKLNQAQAAREIDISDRMMRHYTAGTWPVPRYVWLALERVIELRQLQARKVKP